MGFAGTDANVELRDADMYEVFFQLKQRPFAASPQVEQYYPARGIETARQSLSRCIERAEGAGMLVGPSGSGKTLLLQVLAEQFRSRFAIALLTNGHLTTPRALLQAILFELGLPYRGMEEGELRLSLIDHLAPSSHCPQGMLLLLDEAHSLPLRLLEEIRMITNLVRNGQPRVRLVLAGNASLEERFASPRLEAFSQRITSRCYLESLDRAQTIEYVRHQIRTLGGDPDRTFSFDALESVYRATDGIPRLINQLCDHALLLAYAGNKHQLNGAGIEEAWADLQQLPTPWNQRGADEGDTTPNEHAGVVEFGSLDDDEPLDIHDDLLPDDIASEEFAEDDVAAEDIAAEDFPAGDFDVEHDFEMTLKPTLRLDQISAHLASLDDDFRPIGTIGPEAELMFSPHVDPFAEQFEEEEVVIDRFGSVEASFGDRTHVRSSEGAMLSSLLETFLRPERPQLSIAAAPTADEEHHSVVEVQAAPKSIAAERSSVAPQAAPRFKLNPADDPVMPEENWHVVSASVMVGPPVMKAPVMETFYVEAKQSSDAPPADDRDLIIVEDDPQLIRSERVPAPTVRRQEYRQLFAKLRRG
jgi:type II secretory pathway predicted ATPase ExeA